MRGRAWRFTHPDLDGDGRVPGMSLDPTGRIETVEGAAAVRQSLLLLLSTRRGERVMRPDYGCDLETLAFSPNDETTAGLAMHLVRRAIERHEPRVVIIELDAGPAPDRPGVLEVRLRYRPRAGGAVEALQLALPLTEGM